MSKPKLVYFDIDGARGEAARLAMVIGCQRRGNSDPP